MDEERGTLEALLEELGAAFTPLAEALQSPESFEVYARELGWPLATVPPAVEQLVAPLRALTAGLEEDLPLPDLVDLVGGVVTVIDRIRTAPAHLLPGLPDFATEFPRQVLDRTIIEHLVTTYPAAAGVLRMLDLVEIERVPATPQRLAHTRMRVHWERLETLLRDPLTLADTAYAWSSSFDSERLLRNLRYLLERLGLYVHPDDLPDPVSDSLFGVTEPVTGLAVQIVGDRRTTHGLAIGVRVTPYPVNAGIVVVPYARGELGARFALSDDVALTIDGQGSFGGGFCLLIDPANGIRFLAPAAGAPVALDTAATLGVQVAPDTAEARLLFGAPGGSRFEYRSASLRLGGQFSASRAPVAMIEVELRGGRIVIDVGAGDGFLKAVLPAEGLAFEVGVTAGLNSATGLYFGGSGGLEVALPVHVQVGPLELHSAVLSVKLVDDAVVLEIGVSATADLAALKASVENVGLRASLRFPPDGRGNFGPVDLGFAFKPPSGVGLAIDAGVVKGGGYLFIDADRGEYAGALELTFSEVISVKAIGIISTRMPDGSQGFSLLVIMSAEFGSGLQLGYGFTLLAVGGLLGLNRTMNLPALTEGVRTGAINGIMFPRDVVANAPRIISDLRTYFPAKRDTFLIGPMAKLGWGTPTLVSVSLGVIIEIPGNVAIVGVLRIALPAEEVAVLVLQVNFVGAIEFDRQRVYLFAGLFESRVLFCTIQGELSVLVAWGGDANVVASVGGFHPQYGPPPLPFPTPRTVSIELVNTPVARVRVEGYFAVTSNTAQFGARVELFFGLDALNVTGHVAFDALFRFSPFAFVITVSASLSVTVFGVGLFSVHLRGQLEGPTPWRAHGEGRIKLLFFSIGVNVDVTWGERRDTQLPPIPVLPLVVSELGKSTSWEAQLPAGSNLLVSLRPMPPDEAALILHPVGALRVAQRAVPLDLSLDHVGNQKPADVTKVSVATSGTGLAKQADATDLFAPAQFQALSDAERLSRPAFCPQRSGVVVSAAGEQMRSSHMVKRVVRYEEIIVDSGFKRFARRFALLLTSLFDLFLKGSSVAHAEISMAKQAQRQPFAEVITTAAEGWAVADTATNRTTGVAGAAVFASEASAREHLAGVAAGDSAAATNLHVIPQFELVS
jgi:hypothetical protein